ncbi:hypothetical protein CLAIMM_08898 isoform 1, partial [Cladophialophora immunda]
MLGVEMEPLMEREGKMKSAGRRLWWKAEKRLELPATVGSSSTANAEDGISATVQEWLSHPEKLYYPGNLLAFIGYIPLFTDHTRYCCRHVRLSACKGLLSS